MLEPELIENMALAWLALAGCTFVLLFFVSAPYGRHSREGWGPTLPARLSWVIMETPSALVMPAMLLASSHARDPGSWLFLLLWEAHYIHRAWIYPFLRAPKQKRTPLAVVIMGILFNLINSFINGAYLFYVLPVYGAHWFVGLPFLLGIGFFGLGMGINMHSDNLLSRLGKTESGDYQIPEGGAFRWLSSPNYSGEILQWFGWALATWSLGSLSFAVWTAANLIPRALTHHQWYLDTFPDYPRNRKAVLPFLL